MAVTEGFTPNPGESAGGAGAAGASAGAMLGKGGSLSKEAMDGIKSDVGKMRASAEGGGFGVSEEMGDAYIKAYQNLLEQIPKMRLDVDRAGREAPLGGDEYAMLVAKHSAKMARGDGQSFEAVLEALEVIAEEAIAAFKAAKKSYAEMEAAGERTFSTSELLDR